MMPHPTFQIFSWKPQAPASASLTALCQSWGPSWDYSQVQNYLSTTEPHGILWVVGTAEKVEGACLLQVIKQEAEILALGVQPHLRRQGLARSLLLRVRDQLMAHVHTWHLEVSVRNEAARHLYAQLGFTCVGRRPHYYGPQEDALLLCYATTTQGT